MSDGKSKKKHRLTMFGRIPSFGSEKEISDPEEKSNEVESPSSRKTRSKTAKSLRRLSSTKEVTSKKEKKEISQSSPATLRKSKRSSMVDMTKTVTPKREEHSPTTDHSQKKSNTNKEDSPPVEGKKEKKEEPEEPEAETEEKKPKKKKKKKLKEKKLAATVEPEDDGRDYGDEVFFLPDIPRLIVYSGKEHPYNIQSASIPKLIEKVTTPSKEFNKEYFEYLSVFFMTYRSFTTPETVLDLIVKRFKGTETLSKEEEAKLDMASIREGVCKSVVHWFNNHYRDFSGKPIAKDLEAFIEWAVENYPPAKGNFVGYMHKMYEKKAGKGTYTSLFDSGIMVDKDSCPPPIVPKSWDNITLLDIDELEIARQLTISEHHIYAEIQPVELQELAWSKPKLKHLAPSLLSMIAQFNTFSNAVSSLICTCPKLKLRKKMIEKFVRIAEHLIDMNSFNMVMAIFSGFQNAATHRLHHSFEAVNKNTQESIEVINELLSSKNSYKTYRDMLNQVKPPCIPFLGVYLSDLTFVDEGNPKIVNGLVNFRKKQLEYNVIVQVLRFQSQAYQFKLLPKFSQLFKALPQMSDQELYDASLKIEPRKARKKDIK